MNNFHHRKQLLLIELYQLIVALILTMISFFCEAPGSNSLNSSNDHGTIKGVARTFIFLFKEIAGVPAISTSAVHSLTSTKLNPTDKDSLNDGGDHFRMQVAMINPFIINYKIDICI
jgi:hypothetical protein